MEDNKEKDLRKVRGNKMKTNVTNVTKETNLWDVYSQRVAVELRKRGFKIVRTIPNNKHPQYDMYEFENTPEFQKALKEITG